MLEEIGKNNCQYLITEKRGWGPRLNVTIKTKG